MNVMRYIIVRLLLPALYVWVDGVDNSITIGQSVYTAFCLMGIRKHNRIYLFRLSGGGYGLTVGKCRLDKDNCERCQLVFSQSARTFGFVPTSPSVASMLYESGKLPAWKCRTRLVPRYCKGMFYLAFSLNEAQGKHK